jgi:beta-lactamase class A
MMKLQERVQAVVDAAAGHVSFVLEDEAGNRIDIDGAIQKKAASLIKLPIMLEAFREVDEGRLKLGDRFTIGPHDKVGGAGVIQFFDEGISFTLKDLLTLMITVSDNTATNKVIGLVGVEQVNKFCRDQGLAQTYLERKMMDWEAAAAGKENKTSAQDITACLKVIDDSSVFSRKSRETMRLILSGQRLLDKLPFYMDREKVKVANKTGELPGVEHDCGIIIYGSRKLTVAVLVDDMRDNALGKKAVQNIGRLLGENAVTG